MGKRILEKKVIYITTDERSLNYMFEDESENLDDNIQIISIEDVPAIRKYLPADVKVGDVLVKYPFEENKYIKAEDASARIRLDRFEIIGSIAQKLGASKYEVEQEIMEKCTRIIDGNGTLGYKNVKKEINVHKQQERLKTINVYSSSEYSGVSVISQSSYDDAFKIAEDHNLMDDVMVLNLIKSREPNQQNHLLQKTYRLEMTSELDKLFDAAFSLSVMGSLFDMNAQLKTTLSTKESVKIDIKFYFPSVVNTPIYDTPRINQTDMGCGQ